MRFKYVILYFNNEEVACKVECSHWEEAQHISKYLATVYRRVVLSDGKIRYEFNGNTQTMVTI